MKSAEELWIEQEERGVEELISNDRLMRHEIFEFEVSKIKEDIQAGLLDYVDCRVVPLLPEERIQFFQSGVPPNTVSLPMNAVFEIDTDVFSLKDINTFIESGFPEYTVFLGINGFFEVEKHRNQ